MSTTKLATDKQVAFISKLVAGVENADEILPDVPVEMLDVKSASKLIDALLDAKKAAAAAPVATAPVPSPVRTDLTDLTIPAPEPVVEVEPVNLVGQTFNVSVADGGCTYKVTRDLGGFCTVAHINGGVDDYVDEVLGREAVISRSNIARLVARKGR